MLLRHSFAPPDNTRLSHLCGPGDLHLRTIEAALAVKIAHRHEAFKIDGPKAQARQALELLQALYEMAAKPIPPETVQLMLAGDGLKASKEGVRIYYDGSKRTVVDGPFAEAKELIAGYWIWQVKSMEEAVEWAKRAPLKDGQIELRRAFEAEDFGEAFTPELQEHDQRLRDQLTSQQ